MINVMTLFSETEKIINYSFELSLKKILYDNE